MDDSDQLISHLTTLAQLKPSDGFRKALPDQFAATLTAVSQLQTVNTASIQPTTQVTGKINQLRPDRIDNARILSQTEATQNAPRVYKGYILVPAVFSKIA